ncbi:hypothetical protein H6G74_01125 [Nostoc spongiaeforme FACHB-130]|uniref:Uncharacterized protein n=1 Tax=Nostoc spongiaeforme FACHB-130 TaxID=1357510 RepID=A0ABR8FN96_9NOSO|nr:hypothetical protein [Nostoc spongiaeforme FACHB-130]
MRNPEVWEVWEVWEGWEVWEDGEEIFPPTLPSLPTPRYPYVRNSGYQFFLVSHIIFAPSKRGCFFVSCLMNRVRRNKC